MRSYSCVGGYSGDFRAPMSRGDVRAGNDGRAHINMQYTVRGRGTRAYIYAVRGKRVNKCILLFLFLAII